MCKKSKKFSSEPLGFEGNELIYKKYKCGACEKEIPAYTVDEVIRKEKLCIDCYIKMMTGEELFSPVKKKKQIVVGKKDAKLLSLRREPRKKKKGPSKEVKRQRYETAYLKEEEKWERYVKGNQTLDTRIHRTVDSQEIKD